MFDGLNSGGVTVNSVDSSDVMFDGVDSHDVTVDCGNIDNVTVCGVNCGGGGGVVTSSQATEDCHQLCWTYVWMTYDAPMWSISRVLFGVRGMSQQYIVTTDAQ